MRFELSTDRNHEKEKVIQHDGFQMNNWSNFMSRLSSIDEVLKVYMLEIVHLLIRQNGDEVSKMSVLGRTYFHFDENFTRDSFVSSFFSTKLLLIMHKGYRSSVKNRK